MADLKVKLTEVQEENLKLQKIISGQDQKTRLREKFKLSNSHYILEEDFLSFKRGAYCAHCFEEKGELKVLAEMGIYYLCNSCRGRFQ